MGRPPALPSGHARPTSRRPPLAAGLALLAAALGGLSCSQGGDARPVVAGQARREFNGDSAMSYVRQQLAFGPRVPGTPGWQQTGDWIVRKLRAAAAEVTEQKWTHRLATGRTIPMRNILARFKPQASERVLYVAHWDTRPRADSDPDPANHDTPIPGANDGASGVALLIAVAEALSKAPPAMGVDLLFVDGEDYGTFGPDVDVLIGSTYFASHLPTPGYKPLFGVLWDMIGDADLGIEQEQYSAQQAPEVVQRVWQTARDLGYERYFPTNVRSYPITDDHYPLLKAGLRVIDVIDYPWEWHHTLADSADKVSAQSLQIVGDVAMALLRQ
jgi:hypothetical protein